MRIQVVFGITVSLDRAVLTLKNKALRTRARGERILAGTRNFLTKQILLSLICYLGNQCRRICNKSTKLL